MKQYLFAQLPDGTWINPDKVEAITSDARVGTVEIKAGTFSKTFHVEPQQDVSEFASNIAQTINEVYVESFKLFDDSINPKGEEK